MRNSHGLPAANLPVSTAAPEGLQALLTGILDYAGLFPPARLPLEEAFPNYVRYRQSREAWMLAHFICPANRLQDLAAFETLLDEAAPVPFSVLGGGGESLADFQQLLGAQVAAIRAFVNRFGERMAVPQLELKLPPLLDDVDEAAASALDVVGAAGLEPDLLFFEVGLEGDWRQRTESAIDALVGQGSLRVAYKLRTGGTEPEAFPSPEQVACVLTTCREAGLPFKATAGLHHPIRQFRPEVQTSMHGFFNVFGGAVLAHARTLPMAALRSILEDEDAAHFQFSDDGLAWRDFSASLDEIAAARRRFALSFGSCSFDEPREDLQTLGLF